jgi:hypothetical protein
MTSKMVQDISSSVRKHATLYLIGIGCFLNLCIQMVNSSINGIADPIVRQFYQNSFLSLLCFMLMVAGFIFIFYCRAAGNAPGDRELSAAELASRRFLYTKLIPGLMMLVIGGAVVVIINLSW